MKGVDIALMALARLREQYPDLRAVCFGSHAPKSQAVLADFIEFECAPAQNRIRDIYAQCDVWLTASRCEGFNLPAMEAMACRTPVVATDTGWPSEAIRNGENGFLVAVDDVDGIVQGVSRILDADDAAWRRISEEALHTVADSSWDKSCMQFEAALRRVSQ